MHEEIVKLVRERIENKVIVESTTVPELLDALGLPRNADIVHVFDVFVIHPEYCRVCRLSYRRLMGLRGISEAIDRFGVIYPIIVSRGSNRLWVFDTWLDAIKTSGKLSFAVINVNPDAGELEALIGLIIAVSAMLSRFGEAVVNQVINLIKPFLDKHGVDPSVLIGTAPSSTRSTELSFMNMLRNVKGAITLGEYPECVKATALNYVDSLLKAVSNNAVKPIRLIRMLKSSYSPERILMSVILAIAGESCCYRGFTKLIHNVEVYRELKDVLSRVGFRVDYIAMVNACREAIVRLFTEQLGKDNGLKYASVAVKLFDLIRSMPGSRRGQSVVMQASVSVYLAIDKILRNTMPKYIEQRAIAEAFGVTPFGLRVEASKVTSLSEVKEAIEKLRSELNYAGGVT